jgi:hypothetical protein
MAEGVWIAFRRVVGQAKREGNHEPGPHEGGGRDPTLGGDEIERPELIVGTPPTCIRDALDQGPDLGLGRLGAHELLAPEMATTSMISMCVPPVCAGER